MFQENLTEQLQRQNAALQMLYKTALEAIGATDFALALSDTLSAIREFMQADNAYLGIVDDREAEMRLHSMVGVVRPFNATLQKGEYLLGLAWERAETLLVQDYENWGDRSPYSVDRVKTAIAVPILLGTRVTGVFSLGFSQDRDISAEDKNLLEQFALIFAQIIQKMQLKPLLQKECNGRSCSDISLKQVRRTNFLNALVQGRMRDKGELARQAAEFGFSPEGGRVVMIAQAPGTVLPQPKQEKILQEKLCDCIWNYEEYWVLLCPGAEADGRYEWFSRAKSLRLRLGLAQPEEGGHFGISLYCRELGEINIGFRQARDALEFGRRMQPESQVHHYMDIGLVPILSRAGDKEHVNAFIDQTIGKLVEYDRQKSTRLVETLAAILNGQSLRSVAAGMFIHPKTLLFRKHRIEQLLGVSLDDGSVRMNLSLAVQLYGLR